MTTQQQPRAVSVTTPNEREIHFERIFDAPRDLVWRTFTDPTLIARWWGGGTRVEEMDVRVGGSWRFVAENRQGVDYVFHGTYLEVDPPRRLVQTMVNGWMGDREWTETMEFEDLRNGQTSFAQTSVFATVETRDLVLQSAEQGANFNFQVLDGMLAQIASAEGE